MRDEELRKNVQELQPWYQEIRFNSRVTAESDHSRLSGELAWGYIKPFLPASLDGMRILDLGSNAGLFSVRCAQMGAREVIGIENYPLHLRQCEFVKEYFKTDNVSFIKASLENLPKMDIGKFDVILAIAVLYWVGRHDASLEHYCEDNRKREIEFIKHLATLSDCIIVRGRNKEFNNDVYYNGVFGDLGFGNTTVHESESERVMMKYERRKTAITPVRLDAAEQ